MKVEETIAAIEGCETLEELKALLQRTIENFGFAAFEFIDVGQPHLDLPFYSGTAGKPWEQEYVSNNFLQVDPCIAKIRRSNLPFSWGSVRRAAPHAGRKSGSVKIFEAATDHGFTEGLVVPCHFTDGLGRRYSSAITYFWKDPAQRFRFLLSQKKHDLHLTTIYWIQRTADLIAEDFRNSAPTLRTDANVNGGITLTDREREVLAWAARGKTMSETADILALSNDTVEGYVRSGLRKLSAVNKTQAVARAIYYGLIDV